jgi:CRP-like cAMP-binding protein
MVSYDSENEAIEVISNATLIAIDMEAVRKMLQKNPQIADCLESILNAKRGFTNA